MIYKNFYYKYKMSEQNISIEENKSENIEQPKQVIEEDEVVKEENDNKNEEPCSSRPPWLLFGAQQRMPRWR